MNMAKREEEKKRNLERIEELAEIQGIMKKNVSLKEEKPTSLNLRVWLKKEEYWKRKLGYVGQSY